MNRGLVCCPALALVALLAGGCQTIGSGDGYTREHENDHYHLAKIFIEEGRFADAVRELERAEELRNGQDPEHDAELAFCHMRLGYIADSPESRAEHYQRGLEMAARAAAKRPELADPRAIAGYIYLEIGDVQHAISEYAAASRLDPLDPKVQWNLGEAYLRAGNTSSAIDAFTRAAVADQSYAPRAEARLQELMGGSAGG